MKTNFFTFVSCFIFGILAFSCQSPQAPDKTPNTTSSDLRNKVKKIVLDNGMTFLLLKREGAPIFSAEIRVKVGSIEEQPGFSGLAHFFEHMAFKGTHVIGSKDFSKEQPLLEEILKVGTEISLMKKAGKPPVELLEKLEKLEKLQKEQEKYIENNEFTRIYQENGGKGLNASTSSDFTSYYVSLPTSKLELWAFLESHRLQHSVLREFYKERDVVAEERRMRYENDPNGKLYETLITTAFKSSPYKRLAIGSAEDIQTYTPEAAKDFFKKYYIPSRIVVALVGNFDTNEAETLIKKYFSPLEKRQDTQDIFATETFTDSPEKKQKTITGPEGSRFFLAYHRPAHPHPEDEVLDVVQNILCEGKTSRLYKKLILEKKKVAQINCYSAIPGARLDSLFTFYAEPLSGHTNQEIEKIIEEEIAHLAANGPTETELQIVKNSIDAELVYSLESNSGLATKLAYYQSLTGDWQYIYQLQKRIHSVSQQDIKQAVRNHFTPNKKVSAYFEQVKEKDILD